MKNIIINISGPNKRKLAEVKKIIQDELPFVTIITEHQPKK